MRAIYAPVVDVHWVTLKQLAQLEPTLVETVACMVGALLNDALDEAVNTSGIPEAAARAILLGHTQVALANGLRGDNPFSEACLIAMDYGRESIVRDDWKKVFQRRRARPRARAHAAPGQDRALITRQEAVALVHVRSRRPCLDGCVRKATP